MSWLSQTALWWTLGYMHPFEQWLSLNICPGVGLVNQMIVLFFVFVLTPTFIYFFKLIGYAACEILVPHQRSDPCPLYWKYGVPTIELPGKSHRHVFNTWDSNTFQKSQLTLCFILSFLFNIAKWLSPNYSEHCGIFLQFFFFFFFFWCVWLLQLLSW